jgi:predicted ATPase
VAERLGAVLGNASPAGSDETFWAIRRFLEALARDRPLLVVFEDIHWAEPTFLDLLEYLVGWTRRASILVVCLARGDLLHRQPTWVGPRPNTSLITLDPLSAKEAEALLSGLRDETALSDDAVERITVAAEGNPLFIEQLVAMAAENGANGDLRIPPSIHALLAERLDRLSAPERAVVERAAVIGKEFTRTQISALCGGGLEAEVGPSLMSLTRKELVTPDTSAATSEDGFRFRHVLIRDAAYEGMPKEIRAELHERFAALLESAVGLPPLELDEISGPRPSSTLQDRPTPGYCSISARLCASRASPSAPTPSSRRRRRLSRLPATSGCACSCSSSAPSCACTWTRRSS